MKLEFNGEPLARFKNIFRELNIKAYLVGGAVRDIIVGINPIDFDFTAELSEEEHLKASEEICRLLDCKYKYNNHYHTAKFDYNGMEIDFVMARKESYRGIASKPEVFSSNIIDDIYRRDFTINSIAINMSCGEVIDPTGGISDIEKGMVRVLHEKSFRDDPTRLFRGVKYASRFNFIIEKNTSKLMEECISEGYLGCLSPQRLQQEITGVLDDSEPLNGAEKLHELGVFNFIAGEKVGINLCYNYHSFKELSGKKKLCLIFMNNKEEKLLKLKKGLALGDWFVTEVMKLRKTRNVLLCDDREVFRFLFKKGNSLDFDLIRVAFHNDKRIQNFIEYKSSIKISEKEISRACLKEREDFIINWKIDRLIELTGGKN